MPISFWRAVIEGVRGTIAVDYRRGRRKPVVTAGMWLKERQRGTVPRVKVHSGRQS